MQYMEHEQLLNLLNKVRKKFQPNRFSRVAGYRLIKIKT